VRGYALVLVIFLIAAGSIAMAPAILAAPQNNDKLVVTEVIGNIQVDVAQSTPATCFAGANIPVLQLDFTQLAPGPNTLDFLEVQYSGTDPADVTVGTLWRDDGDHLFNPATDMMVGAPVPGVPFTWGAMAEPIAIGVGITQTYFVQIQTDNGATIGNIVDGLILPGGMILQVGGPNLLIMDPNDPPDFCTIISNIGPPQAVYGYVKLADMVTPVPGATVTVLDTATGESLNDVSDALGRYDVDMNDLLFGYANGDFVEVTTPAPNQGYNSTNLIVPSGGQQVDVIVDDTPPLINFTIAAPLYVNTQGTFGGTTPPVNMQSQVWDQNIAAAAMGVRNEDTGTQPNETYYVSYNFTTTDGNFNWDGSWYFIAGGGNEEIVTATFSDAFGTDTLVFGEINGASNSGDVIGYTASHYVVFDQFGVYQSTWITQGTLSMSDDVQIFPGGADTFRPYIYEGGQGYIAGVNTYTFVVTPVLNNYPIVDGRYTVVTAAIDMAQNSNWTNEADGNPIITVDNYAPDADATGPAGSNVYAFDVEYNFNDVVAPNLAPTSPVVNVTLWYSFNAGAWALYGTDPTPGDGLFPVDVTLTGDGTYDWWMVSWDMTDNHELGLPMIEATTIVDTLGPTINPTTVNINYINNQGTFGGTPPPVMVTTSVTDPNLATAAWGIRNNLQVGNSTLYFTCNFTIDPSTHQWDGSWYFIENVLVTANLAPEIMMTDLAVFGDLNNATINTGDVIGYVLPNYYAVFDAAGTYQAIYDSMGTLDYGDDTQVMGLGPADYFRAFRYDEGDGFVATALNRFDPEQVGNEMTLQILPIPDGDYAVITSAMDAVGNTAWRNESDGDPVITVDNYAPDADATGPAGSTVYAFDVEYNFVDVIAPNGAVPSPVVNVTLWYSYNAGVWTLYGTDPTPGDGLFPVNVTLIGDGTYDWYMVSWDATDNHELGLPVIEATTIVDTLGPTINPTLVDLFYINNQGTFGGTPPPMTVTTSVNDPNLAVAAWGIRNNLQVGNSTIYFSCNFTMDPSVYQWQGTWYFIENVLVTANIAPEIMMTDYSVFGDLNNASINTGDVIGNVLPNYYAVFDAAGAYQAIYDTMGTLDYGDDTQVMGLGPADYFRAFRYDEGDGFVATALNRFDPEQVGNEMTLQILPIPDGDYAVVTSAMDDLGNRAWRNETDGDPVITVDNYAPDADATGPAISGALGFDVTYTFTDVMAPNGAIQSPIVNVTLWFSFNAGPWTLYGIDSTPGDGLFPVVVGAEGTYDWFMVSWDATDNHELGLPVIEATTIVDIGLPLIGPTTVNTSYVNSQGTWNGIAPPVQISTSYVEPNVEIASIGIRNFDSGAQPNNTYYATYNFTASPTSWDWNCMWYFLSGAGNSELVTVTYSEAYVGDIIVWGEYNGANPPGFVYGNNLPPNYLLFQPGPVVVLYSTMGTIDVSDDAMMLPLPGDNFRPYIYEGGVGYITGFNLYPLLPIDPVLTGIPIIDGQYTVVVGVLDTAGNSNYTNEADGNPVITVDTIQPALTTEYVISVDGGTAGAVDTGDTLTIWVNVTDVNEDATCIINVDVDEVGFPDQAVAGLAYMGAGVWQCTYVVQGPAFTVSNIDVSFRDLAQNLVDAPDNATYNIYGLFTLNYAAGWNLVGIPVLNPVVGGVAFTNAYNFTQAGATMVSKWDFATQGYINFIAGFHLPGEPRDFALMPDEAYWIWMPAAGSIAFDGDLPGPRNVAVNGPGWNMVSYMDPVNVGDVETDWAPFVTCGAYDDIAYYDTGTSTFVHYIFPGTVMNLVPGRGYFVWSDIPAAIIY